MQFDSPPMEQRERCSVASMWIDPRGFVVIDQNPGVLQTRETATEMFSKVREMIPGDAKIPVLVIANQSRTDRGARRVFLELGSQQCACVAFVIASRVSEVTGNFFLRVNQPPYPLRLFPTPEAAVPWILDHVGSTPR